MASIIRAALVDAEVEIELVLSHREEDNRSCWCWEKRRLPLAVRKIVNEVQCERSREEVVQDKTDPFDLTSNISNVHRKGLAQAAETLNPSSTKHITGGSAKLKTILKRGQTKGGPGLSLRRIHFVKALHQKVV